MKDDNSGKSELLEILAQVFGNLAAPLQEHVQELQAQLSAQAFLLEMAYANQFLHEPEAFDEFMRRALDATRKKAVRTAPMSASEAEEMQARVATRLQRFHESVARRIAQGPSD